MLTTPEQYLGTLEGPGRAWLEAFLTHMSEKHADIAPIMFRQRPMYRVGESYVLFSVAQRHFTVHTLNFELIEALRERLPGAGFGKGSVNVKFTDEAARALLFALCDEVVRLNRLADAPPVDVVPEQPYAVKLQKAFSGGKAKWLPLYEALLHAARARLPEFIEYFPAVNVLWKRGSTFAQFSAVAGALRVEFFSDAEHPERNPIKLVRTSANRVAHIVECREPGDLASALHWIAESCELIARARG